MSAPKPLPSSRPGSFWSLFDRPGGWLFMLLFLAATAGALVLQALRVRSYGERPWVESFVLPKSEFVERLAIGYNAWMADFLYLRAIQAFGGIYFSHEEGARQYDAVFNYFDVISALDPHFIEAYTFGSLVMGDEGARQDLALKYLEQGQDANWRHYVPWYEAAFIKIWGAKEPDRQARFFVRQAVKCPDAPDWIGRWESFIDQQAGQYRFAIQRWVQTYAQALDSNEPYLVNLALHKFRPIVSEWHKRILQDAADKFQKERGASASDLEQLASEGFLPPVDVVDPDLLVKTLEDLTQAGVPIGPNVDKIVDSCVVKKSGILPCYDDSPPNDRYVLICLPDSDRREVWKESQREYTLTLALKGYREQIEAYRREHGRYPETVDGWKLDIYDKVVPDPYCRGWVYEPQTGILRSKGRPDL